MTNNKTHPADSLSALTDGELTGPEKDRVLAELLSSPKLQSQWHAYHVVGDVLRSDELATAAGDLQFLNKLEARLAHEVCEPQVAVPSDTDLLDAPVALVRGGNQSANSSLFRWRAVAGTACTLLAAVLLAPGWVKESTPVLSATASAPVSYRAAESALADNVVGLDGMIRDPRIDQLLNAHQQLGGHSALQMPSGFLRNATYEGVKQ